MFASHRSFRTSLGGPFNLGGVLVQAPEGAAHTHLSDIDHGQENPRRLLDLSGYDERKHCQSFSKGTGIIDSTSYTILIKVLHLLNQIY